MVAVVWLWAGQAAFRSPHAVHWSAKPATRLGKQQQGLFTCVNWWSATGRNVTIFVKKEEGLLQSSMARAKSWLACLPGVLYVT